MHAYWENLFQLFRSTFTNRDALAPKCFNEKHKCSLEKNISVQVWSAMESTAAPSPRWPQNLYIVPATLV